MTSLGGYEAANATVLACGGEMGALMRAMDWAATLLGPVATWPQALKTCVRLMLSSRQLIWLGWGHDLTFPYNDPYRSIVGGEHPWALGQPTAVVWREIWADIAPRLQSALEGDEGTYDEALLLIMERHGYPEETYYTFCYSPIPDDGRVAGIFCANTNDMRRVSGECQMGLAGILIVGLNPFRLFEAYPGFLALAAGQITTDLASTRAYEEERTRAETLAALDRAKTAFCNDISHEFRTRLH